VFINSEELLDFPRPILHKIIYMGGVGMREQKAGSLPLDLQQFLDGSKDAAVLISFGSVANSTHMPISWLKVAQCILTETLVNQIYLISRSLDRKGI
jgi:hypothetical protein